MKDVKCVDCDEYRNEWCEKVIDSPHPDMIRDCQYWHKRKDLVEVIRCKDCRYYIPQDERCRLWCQYVDPSEWCSRAKRKDGEADG